MAVMSTAQRIAVLTMEGQLRAKAGSSQPAAIQRAFVSMAKAAHPDAGGDTAEFARLVEAKDQLLTRLDCNTKDASMTVATATHPAQRRSAPANAILPQEEQHRTWCTTAPLEHTIEDALNPGYLFARHRQMKLLDRFEIAHAGYDYLVRGIIVGIDADGEALQYRALEILKLSEMPVVGPDWEGAKVEEEQPHGWSVRLDGRIAKRFHSEASAKEWVGAKQALAREGVVPRNPENSR